MSGAVTLLPPYAFIVWTRTSPLVLPTICSNPRSPTPPELLDPEEEGTTALRNVGEFLPVDTA
jgi:hypothetical protein